MYTMCNKYLGDTLVQNSDERRVMSEIFGIEHKTSITPKYLNGVIR